MSESMKFRGIYPILYAFFDRQGKLDREAMGLQIRACLDAGAHGLAMLGLATEVAKLEESERLQIVEWAAEEVSGRVPMAVTVFGHSVDQQIRFAKMAQSSGADWLILQPPPVKGLSEADWLDFFGRVMDSTSLPVAIQNAPEYLGVGLSVKGLMDLQQRHPNFTLLKGEGPAGTMAEVIRAMQGKLSVFNGRGGLELNDNLRAGCVGMGPAPECVDRQIRIFELMAEGGTEAESEAERIYQEILPVIVFVMQSIEHFLCYGKRILAARLGLDVHDRLPSMTPTAFGLERVQAYAKMLGPWPGK